MFFLLNTYRLILSAENYVGSVFKACTGKHNLIGILRNYFVYTGCLLLLNENGDPILFQNLGFYYIDNQSAMLDKNLTAGSILEE